VRAALYKRVSTAGQCDGVSLELQEEKLRAYCTLQGWTIAEVYEDAGLSGSTTDRPDYQKMLKDAGKNKFDVIVVYKLDRLSRSVLDFHNLCTQLDKNNISIVSVTQNLDTSTPVGRLLRNILIDFANFEREMIAERTMDAKYNIARKGQWIFGPPPFGYKVENKQLVVVPEEAEKVRKIYDLCIKGYGKWNIAKELNLKIGTVEKVLKNQVYTGALYYNRTQRQENGTKKLRDESEWIVIEDSHKAIIDKQTYYAAQASKAERDRVPKSRVTHQVFPGKCYCAECGNKMYYHNYRKNGKRYAYYACNGKNRIDINPCGIYIKENRAEKMVINKLTNIINDKTYWENLSAALEQDTADDEIKILKAEYNKSKIQIENLIDNMAITPGISHVIAPRIKQLESRQNEIQKAIEKLELSPKIDATLSLIKNFIGIWDNMTPAEKAESTNIIIEKIILSPESAKIKLRDRNIPIL